jgi:hypothetical protein
MEKVLLTSPKHGKHTKKLSAEFRYLVIFILLYVHTYFHRIQVEDILTVNTTKIVYIRLANGSTYWVQLNRKKGIWLVTIFTLAHVINFFMKVIY